MKARLLVARRVLFWCHLAVGLGVGLWVLFMAITGIIIAYQAEFISFAEMSYRISQPEEGICKLPSVLLTTVEGQSGRTASTLVLFSDPHRPAEVLFGRKEVWLIDPCRGRILAAGTGPLRRFFRSVVELHYAAKFRNQTHPWLRQIKDAANLGFFLLLISGILLWIPRRWRWSSYKAVVLIRKGAKRRSRDWNLHHVIGIWAVVPLLLISSSGAVLAYPWARGLLYRAAHEQMPPPRKAEPISVRSADRTWSPTFDRAIALAMQQDPHWQRLEMSLPSASEHAVAITIDDGDGGKPQKRIRLQYSLGSVALIKAERFDQLPRGRQWTLYARYLHTGEFFGVFGKCIALLAGLSAILLVWTGFALSYRRWKTWRQA
jgi:uncharacterized iron-regulated membrane protein